MKNILKYKWRGERTFISLKITKIGKKVLSLLQSRRENLKKVNLIGGKNVLSCLQSRVARSFFPPKKTMLRIILNLKEEQREFSLLLN